jgi:hypothetical protein
MWRALAVGDSCLFCIRAGRLLRSFPLTQSTEFGNQPSLVGSRGRELPGIDRNCEQKGGSWRQGDRFLLATDAIAQWFLGQVEQEAEPAVQVAALLAESNPEEAFAGWTDERRREHVMRNDDVTMVVIDL